MSKITLELDYSDQIALLAAFEQLAEGLNEYFNACGITTESSKNIKARMDHNKAMGTALFLRSVVKLYEQFYAKNTLEDEKEGRERIHKYLTSNYEGLRRDIKMYTGVDVNDAPPLTEQREASRD